MRTILIISIAVAYFVEWFKNFLPNKVTGNQKAMAGIAAAFSVIAALGYQFINKTIEPGMVLTWQSISTFTIGVVAYVQLSYNLLVQIGIAIKKKLQSKVNIDVDETADEIADKIVESITISK